MKPHSSPVLPEVGVPPTLIPVFRLQSGFNLWVSQQLGQILPPQHAATPPWTQPGGSSLSLPAGGSSNQVLGINAAGNSYEWKTLNPVANETDVAHAAGAVAIGIADPLGHAKGGTGLSALGTANQYLRTNAAATAMEWDGLAAADLSDFSEAVDDRVDALLSCAAPLAKAYNDAGGTLSVFNLSAFPLWSSAYTYSPGYVVLGSDGNLYRAIASSTGSDPTSDAYSKWELFRVNVDTTLAIDGTRFAKTAAGFNDAWSFGRHATIPPDVTLTISVGAATYTFSTALTLNHPFGTRIAISGAGSSSTTFSFQSATDGVVVGSGYTLGGQSVSGINGVKLYGDATATTRGVYANGGRLSTGTDMVVNNFGVGVRADGNGFINCTSIQVTSFITIGITSLGSAVINCQSATITATATTNTDALRADVMGTISATSATVAGTTISAVNYPTRGIAAAGMGKVYASSSSVSTCATGYLATGMSTIYVNGNTVSGNTANYSPALNTVGSNNSLIFS